MWHDGIGTIIYDPNRGVMNARADAALTLYNLATAELASQKSTGLTFNSDGKLTIKKTAVRVEDAVKTGYVPSNTIVSQVMEQFKLTRVQVINAFTKALEDPNFRRKAERAAWWCIVDIDKEITRYYRWWVMKERWIELNQPSWNAHISVLRGERPAAQKMDLWRKYHGQKVAFRYKHNVRQSGDTTGGDRPDHYWFVEVESEKLTEIRKELGLPHNWNFHITVGRTYSDN